MAESSAIKAAMDRMRETFAKRPEAAHVTKAATCRILDGLSAEMEIDGQRVAVDMPKVMGGGETGANPGGWARGAISACLAIATSMALADRGLSVEGLEVEVEADSDLRGALGMEGPVAWTGVRCTARVTGAADPEAVREAFEHAVRCSVVGAVVRSPVPVETRLELVETDPAPA